MLITPLSIKAVVLTKTSQFYVEKTLFDLSIIIPVYNNQEKILEVLNDIKSSLYACVDNYEIIIVDDGSTDNTLSILQNEEQLDRRLHIITYPKNAGKGFAVKTGILACRGSKCLFIDGDLDIRARGLGDYFRELESFDMVVASKTHELSEIHASNSRKFLSQAFNFFVRTSTGISVKDTQCGLKAGDSAILKEIFSSMRTSRYAFDVELLMIASKIGLKIKEMPVQMSLRSKFKFMEIIRMLHDVLRISYRYRIQNKIFQ